MITARNGAAAMPLMVALSTSMPIGLFEKYVIATPPRVPTPISP
jgi:hypothetical protein